MRIDRTHKPWMIWTVALAAVSAIAYIVYAVQTPAGPRGGSALGIVFGSVGYGMMLYAAALGLRKKRPTWRVGKAQTWMRGHLWFGTLSLLLILFHGGFAFRGPLTLLLMILFFIVIASGLAGAIIQHYLPRMMTLRVPMETIYEEIPQVRAQLLGEADQLAQRVCGQLDEAAPAEAVLPGQQTAAVTTLVDIEKEDRARFRDIYLRKVRPYFEDPDADGAELHDERRAAEVFQSLRVMLVAPVHSVLDDLEGICEEEHQLSRQVRIYRWLHGWLLVHVPLSIALLVLGAVHAVMALRY